MDGLEDRGQVIVIGATNRLDAIDSAVRRVGRLSEKLNALFRLPEREEILGVHSRSMPLSNEVDMHVLSRNVGLLVQILIIYVENLCTVQQACLWIQRTYCG